LKTVNFTFNTISSEGSLFRESDESNGKLGKEYLILVMYKDAIFPSFL
jgi:hypothetical protein